MTRAARPTISATVRNRSRRFRSLGVSLMISATGRSEAAGAARRLVEALDLGPDGLDDRRDHQLADAFAPADDEVLFAVVDQDNLHLAPVVGVDGARRVEAGDPVLERQARAWPHLAFEAGREREGETRRHGEPRARAQRQRLVLRHGGAQVHAGRLGGLVGGQRQVRAMRQAGDRDGRVHLSSWAMRWASRRATSPLAIRSHRSIPPLVTRATALSSPPMVPATLTSLATIQSQPFLASLALAWTSTSLVSAAKPITSRGRALPFDRLARMSGFSVSAMAPGAWPSFLIFLSPAGAGRQSATAATQTAMSAGSAASQALSMSRALSTSTRLTPAGAESAVGPLTRVTSAPSAARAPAMA